jgi:orotidine-5'-phosphate decarboxylase
MIRKVGRLRLPYLGFVTTKRALNTVYTNGNRRRLVIVTVYLQTSSSTDYAIATFQSPAKDVVTNYQSQARLEGVAGKIMVPVWGVVNPMETYRVLASASPGGGSVTIAYWTEVDL